MKTLWVFGDQLNTSIGALARAQPGDHRLLMVESGSMIQGRPYHRQRLHFVIASMRRFAQQLSDRGFAVDYRRAASLRSGYLEHVGEFGPTTTIATEPNSRRVAGLLDELGVERVRSNQFLCHPEDFADWAGGKESLRLETFYRWQRKRLGYLLDQEGKPEGGRWNFDDQNREPPPSDGTWEKPVRSVLDALDREVLDDLPAGSPGESPVGWWATSRRAALARLNHFVDRVLPGFGPHEDAMLSDNWHLAHSLLSPYLNIGLLLPGEVCDRVEAAYRAGRVPINSAEGFIRQVIGWREFVWGIYWLWPQQEDANAFGHSRDIPPSWLDQAQTGMNCVAQSLAGLRSRGWVHHIQRLMIFSNFANLYGMEPAQVRNWMRERYVDGADWVMGPNVMGMGLWADGGRMSTKPYVSSGSYIDRMSDYCRSCEFDPKRRAGETACPFTTLYWDFLERNRDVLKTSGRMGREYHNLDRLDDLDAVQERARWVVASLAAGSL